MEEGQNVTKRYTPPHRHIWPTVVVFCSEGVLMELTHRPPVLTYVERPVQSEAVLNDPQAFPVRLATRNGRPA